LQVPASLRFDGYSDPSECSIHIAGIRTEYQWRKIDIIGWVHGGCTAREGFRTKKTA
jgi:hypothetical protein